VADDPASDEPPPGWGRAMLAVWMTICGAAIVAAMTIEEPALGLIDVLFPYPLIALAASPLIAWIVARARRAPPRSRIGRLVPWSWVVVRFSVLSAMSCMMIAWIVAALIGASFANILLEAFLLTAVAQVTFFFVEQCAIEVGRAVRGPVGAGP
jgi:hypothetical protein